MTMQGNPTAVTDQRRTHPAVEAAQFARRRAEHELRRTELERDQTARALELNPRGLDEASRERLRIAYADAAAAVAVHRDTLERAVAIENAAAVLAAAVDDMPGSEVADDLLQLLDQRQRTRTREVPPPTARARRTSADARTTLR